MILHVRPIGLLTGISVVWVVGVLSAQDACKNPKYRKQKIRFALLQDPPLGAARMRIFFRIYIN